MSAFQSVATAINTKSNLFGAFASGLCLVHCIATPLLFVAQAASHDHHHNHHHEIGWWGSLDYIFLVISAIAIYYSAKNSSLRWMPFALYTSWIVLAFLILSEKFELVHLPHDLIYFPTLGLIALHIYNSRYCNCADEECCIPE